jgi:hypothetical protein
MPTPTYQRTNTRLQYIKSNVWSMRANTLAMAVVMGSVRPGMAVAGGGGARESGEEKMMGLGEGWGGRGGGGRGEGRGEGGSGAGRRG